MIRICTALALLVGTTAVADETPVFRGAYTDQLSYRPGDAVSFHAATNVPGYDVEIARVGAERVVVQTKTGLRGQDHPIPANASSHGCGWPVAFTVTVPPEWNSGYYTARRTATAIKV